MNNIIGGKKNMTTGFDKRDFKTDHEKSYISLTFDIIKMKNHKI